MLFYSSILDLSLKKLVFIELYVCKCWIVFILKRNDWPWRDGARDFIDVVLQYLL